MLSGMIQWHKKQVLKEHVYVHQPYMCSVHRSLVRRALHCHGRSDGSNFSKIRYFNYITGHYIITNNTLISSSLNIPRH